MPITVEQVRQQYIRNAAGLSEMLEAGRKATDSGRNGRRFRGYTFAQLVGMFVGCVESTNASDADLAPVVQALSRAFSR